MSESIPSSNFKNEEIDFNLIYPFNDKPKIVPLLKKAIALIFFLGCLIWYLIHFVGGYIAKEIIETQNSFFFIEVDGSKQSAEITIQQKEKLQLITKQFYKQSLVSSLMYALPFLVLYLLYQAFKQQKYKKNIFGVSNLYLIVTIFYFLIIGAMLFWRGNLFYQSFPLSTPIQEIIKNSRGVAIYQQNGPVVIKFWWIDQILLNKMWIWQLIRAANILMVVVLFINIVFSILLFILKPKVNQEKIKKIQKEIRKKAEANLQGKKYEMDSSIFQ